MRPLFVLTLLGLGIAVAAVTVRPHEQNIPVRIPAELQLAARGVPLAGTGAMQPAVLRGEAGRLSPAALMEPSITLSRSADGGLMLMDQAGRWIAVEDPQQLMDALIRMGVRPRPIKT